MTLRGLAALGVLAIAGCKQPIINVYPAACATPTAYSGGLEEYSFNMPVVMAYAPTPMPVATPTPWDGSPREANGGEEWASNGWGHWEKDDNGEARPPLATPTTTPEVVAGCPSMVLVLIYETQQTIKLPFDYAMTEAHGESNCWYWLNGDQANGMHGQGVSILRGKQ